MYTFNVLATVAVVLPRADQQKKRQPPIAGALENLLKTNTVDGNQHIRLFGNNIRRGHILLGWAPKKFNYMKSLPNAASQKAEEKDEPKNVFSGKRGCVVGHLRSMRAKVAGKKVIPRSSRD